MKKKLELNKLTVSSFVTKKNEEKIMGGAKPTRGCDTNSCYTWGCGGCSDIVSPCVG